LKAALNDAIENKNITGLMNIEAEIDSA